MIEQQKCLAMVVKPWGLTRPDHRYDIAQAAWNAAVAYTANRAAELMAEYDGSTFGLERELLSCKV